MFEIRGWKMKEGSIVPFRQTGFQDMAEAVKALSEHVKTEYFLEVHIFSSEQ